ncbi:MAG: hypothetical protein ACE5R6_20915 [Candidatus Heimdallarchaeota archaeon]
MFEPDGIANASTKLSAGLVEKPLGTLLHLYALLVFLFLSFQSAYNIIIKERAW